MPESMFAKVKNLAAFAGMLVVDKWLGNANGRQAVFWKKTNERKYTATFIDQGYCFNAGEWNFPDSALRGVYARNFVYQDVRGWESFDPWLTRVENFDAAMIHEIAGTIPPAVDRQRLGRDGNSGCRDRGTQKQSAGADYGISQLHATAISQLGTGR